MKKNSSSFEFDGSHIRVTVLESGEVVLAFNDILRALKLNEGLSEKALNLAGKGNIDTCYYFTYSFEEGINRALVSITQEGIRNISRLINPDLYRRFDKWLIDIILRVWEVDVESTVSHPEGKCLPAYLHLEFEGVSLRAIQYSPEVSPLFSFRDVTQAIGCSNYFKGSVGLKKASIVAGVDSITEHKFPSQNGAMRMLPVITVDGIVKLFDRNQFIAVCADMGATATRFLKWVSEMSPSNTVTEVQSYEPEISKEVHKCCGKCLEDKPLADIKNQNDLFTKVIEERRQYYIRIIDLVLRDSHTLTRIEEEVRKILSKAIEDAINL